MRNSSDSSADSAPAIHKHTQLYRYVIYRNIDIGIGIDIYTDRDRYG